MPSTSKEIKFEIVKNVGILATNKSGWNREANIVRWNDGKAKLDIRDWGPDHEKTGKGITLNREEAAVLKSLLEDFDTSDIEA